MAMSIMLKPQSQEQVTWGERTKKLASKFRRQIPGEEALKKEGMNAANHSTFSSDSVSTELMETDKTWIQVPGLSLTGSENLTIFASACSRCLTVPVSPVGMNTCCNAKKYMA